MAPREKAARLRAELKAAGYNARKVSIRVRDLGVSAAIDATIRDLSVDPATVRRICMGAETVRRCEASGDILGGGNTYVEVRWAEGLLEGFAADVAVALRAGEAVTWNGWRAEPKCGDPGYFIAARVVPRIGGRDDIECWGADYCARQVAERVLADRAAAESTLATARRALLDETAALREAQAELDYFLAEEDLDVAQVVTATQVVHERSGLVQKAAFALDRAQRAAGRCREAA